MAVLNLLLAANIQARSITKLAEVVYDNVRDLSDERLRGREGSWTVIVDVPFDLANRTPADDLALPAQRAATMAQARLLDEDGAADVIARPCLTNSVSRMPG